VSDNDSVPRPQLEAGEGARGESRDDDAGHQDAGHANANYRAHRRELIAQMMLMNIPYRLIATQLGIGKSTVAREAERIREAWRERTSQSIEAHVAEQLGVLDKMRSAALAIALASGGGKDRLAAIEAVRKIEERRSRLLGLDRPTQITVTQGVADQAARGVGLIDELERARARKRPTNRKEAQ
jgi:hypothetical protein